MFIDFNKTVVTVAVFHSDTLLLDKVGLELTIMLSQCKMGLFW